MLSDRQKSLFFLIGTIALVFLISVWFIFLNKGTLVINGEVPFSVKVKGKKQYLCLENPCVIKMPPRVYNLVLRKEGFYEQDMIKKVSLWQKNQFNVELREVALLHKEEESPSQRIQYPSNIRKISYFANKIDQKVFSKYQDEIRNIIFSPKASFAILYLDDKYILLDLIKDKEVELGINNIIAIKWNKNEQSFYYLNSQSEEEKQSLNKYTIESDTHESLSYFPREIKRAIFSFNKEENKIIMIDISTSSNQTVYLINVDENWRKSINKTSNIVNLSWDDNLSSILLEQRIQRSRRSNILILNTVDHLISDIGISGSLDKLQWINENTFVYSSDQKIASLETDLDNNYMIEIIRQQFLKPTESENIIEFDISSKSFKLFFKSNEALPLTPEKLELDLLSRRLFFHQGSQLYSISI